MHQPFPGMFARQHRRVSTAVLTLMWVAAFDSVAVVAALPAIGGSLGVVERLPWVLTGYLMASAVAVIGAGPVIDSIGLRVSFQCTVVIYTLSSLACALAPTFEVLALLRVVQGLGGGLVLATSMSTIGIAYSEPVRSRVVAANTVVWGLASAVGPAVVAVIVTGFSWRGVFLASVAMAALAASAGWTTLPSGVSAVPRGVPFDNWSMLLLTGFVVTGLLGVSGQTVEARLALAAAVGFAILYWRVGSRRPSPVLERRYIAGMPFAAINMAAAACFGVVLGLNSFLPIYVRLALGESEQVAAFSVLFVSLGWMMGSMTLSRVLHRFRREKVTLYGYVLVAGAILGGVAAYSVVDSLVLALGLFLLMGVGLGIVSLCLLTLLQARAADGEVGRATAAFQFFRTLGYTYGAALAGLIVFASMASAVGDIGPVQEILGGDTVVGHGDLRQAFAAGFRLAHAGALAVLAGGFAAALALWSRRR